MNVKNYRYDGSQELSLKKAPTSAKGLGLQRQEIEEKTRSNMRRSQSSRINCMPRGRKASSFCFRPWTPPGRTAPSSM